MFGYVYILQSLVNNRLYIGSTKYTSITAPFKLVFSQEFETLILARQMEYKLKQLKSRKVLDQIVSAGKFYINERGKVNW